MNCNGEIRDVVWKWTGLKIIYCCRPSTTVADEYDKSLPMIVGVTSDEDDHKCVWSIINKHNWMKPDWKTAMMKTCIQHRIDCYFRVRTDGKRYYNALAPRCDDQRFLIGRSPRMRRTNFRFWRYTCEAVTLVWIRIRNLQHLTRQPHPVKGHCFVLVAGYVC